jgi:hypothetical protein
MTRPSQVEQGLQCRRIECDRTERKRELKHQVPQQEHRIRELSKKEDIQSKDIFETRKCPYGSTLLLWVRRQGRCLALKHSLPVASLQ